MQPHAGEAASASAPWAITTDAAAADYDDDNDSATAQTRLYGSSLLEFRKSV